MGKKKPQKTKELSVAIAEASPTGQQQFHPQAEQQTQPQTPRKRGRPRKIVEKTIREEEKEKSVQQPATSTEAEGTDGALKKVKISEEEQYERQQVGSSACIRVTKEEEVSEEKQPSKGEPSRRRARRKSKPRKSS